MLVIFTDLDGTLLDDSSYSFDEARTALDLIKEMAMPLVPVTSKTRAEVEVLRARLENRHPFVVENGGALYVPQAYFPFPLPASSLREGYSVIEVGDPYEDLVRVLREASSLSHCRVIGFHDMSVEEISFRCGLPKDQALLAKQREYDEPFEILDSGDHKLLEGIERRNKRWTRGGRFYHIVGGNDKAHCVRLLIGMFRRAFGKVTAAGLGDGLNDAGFLEAVDIPIVMKSPDSTQLLKRVPRARLSELPGSKGWNRAVLEILQEHGTHRIDQLPGGSSGQT